MQRSDAHDYSAGDALEARDAGHRRAVRRVAVARTKAVSGR